MQISTKLLIYIYLYYIEKPSSYQYYYKHNCKNVFKMISMFIVSIVLPSTQIELWPLCAAAVCLAAASASVTVWYERLVQLLLRFCRAKIIFGALRA